MLITFAGCALATGVITEMFKKIGFLANLHAQLVSYFVAFIILLGATLTLGQFTWSGTLYDAPERSCGITSR